MDSMFFRELLCKAFERILYSQAENQMKSDFMTHLSYELRTPLTSIVGMAHLLSIDTLLPNQQKYVTNILTASEHMLSLVDELLHSTLTAINQVSLEVENFNLKILLKTTMDMLRFHALAKGIQFELEYAEDVPITVKGDMRLVRQIILNLLGRSLKHTHQGSVIITVSCVTQTPQFGEIALSIKDTGSPLSEEEIAKIQTCLSTTDHSSIRRYGSIDLGLLMVISHLKSMRAKMEVSSRTPQPGTIITCLLPFQLPTASMAIKEEDGLTPVSASIRPFNKKLRILLVEDDEIIQAVHHGLLRKLHAAVDIAKNSKTALSLYTKQSYDIILMDIGLPDQDGLETTRKIRQLEAGKKRIPIIALTAHGQKEDTQFFLSAGIDEVLIKPVGISDFIKFIERWTAG